VNLRNPLCYYSFILFSLCDEDLGNVENVGLEGKLSQQCANAINAAWKYCYPIAPITIECMLVQPAVQSIPNCGKDYCIEIGNALIYNFFL